MLIGWKNWPVTKVNLRVRDKVKKSSQIEKSFLTRWRGKKKQRAADVMKRSCLKQWNSTR